MNICPGCGGVLGRDCFNTIECQQIAASMNNQAQSENEELQAKLQQVEQENEKLKEVLRFADCPELIIENPDFIKGKKPTDKDMEWANAKVKEYIAVEKSKDEQIGGLRKALDEICAYKVDLLASKWRLVSEMKSIAEKALKQP